GQEQPSYSEQSVWLPETYWCYQPPDVAPPVTPLAVNTAGAVTFGCLNNFGKVTAAALDAWGRLLQALPQARLLIHAQEGSHRARVYERFAQQGILPARVSFTELVPAADYYRTHADIDIALDPFPYGGGTTTCDALWMGVPVVSLAGHTAVGR